MSFRIDFVGYDHASLLHLAGSGDDSAKNAILETATRYHAPDGLSETRKPWRFN
jgi:hypothetical protein